MQRGSALNACTAYTACTVDQAVDGTQSHSVHSMHSRFLPQASTHVSALQAQAWGSPGSLQNANMHDSTMRCPMTGFV